MPSIYGVSSVQFLGLSLLLCGQVLAQEPSDEEESAEEQAEETVKNVVNQRSAYLLFYELQS